MTGQPYYGFVDGGYLRANSLKELGHEFMNPRSFVSITAREAGFQDGPWHLERTLYFDALPEPDETAGKSHVGTTDLELYFDAVEQLADTEMRFGYVRGRPDGKKRRQKAVDIQLAVDMLVASFERLFRVAVLIAGDADFVPAVYEAKRRGVRIVVAGFENNMSDLLVKSADRLFVIPPNFKAYKLKFK